MSSVAVVVVAVCAGDLCCELQTVETDKQGSNWCQLIRTCCVLQFIL